MSTRPHLLPGVIWAVVLAVGWLALFVRPVATAAGWGVIVAVGALGILAPARQDRPRAGRVWWIGAVAVGVAAFTAARMLAMHAPVPGTLLAFAATSIAAVSEEAFFRRVVYGWLARWGDGVAVAGAATAFAAVHLRGYGLWSLPVNLAAGLLFGWQRWATGRWSSAAATHAIANLLQTL
ncbi:MAG: CPBP family intramembrane metalloprotease [Bacillati bacterium ANGP1]|uniref:CPBP family intramembrane metalloprotease n=1 Tax=Candidatus Segetimicrobium genomatis TaxID=2569760 RepID=A0A537L789_9BACT|nr:MAG: CPBP family intramembrane metalloprotease [Terrabacteria group bacterium ANGP1]